MVLRIRGRSFICKLTILCAVIFIISTLVLIMSPDPLSNRPDDVSKSRHLNGCGENRNKIFNLAVVVPFRDRFEELLEFVPHMRDFLTKQKICHTIIVVNQVDSLRFNRGALVNVGFRLGVNASCDYMVMHDVDLLPMNDNLSYSFPSNGPFHVAAPGLHPKYNYTKFVGGILLITNEHYLQTNGMSNRFWGWGREDDEFYLRMNESNLQISRPEGITTGKATFKHNHGNPRRQRDNLRYGKQKQMNKDRSSGVDNVDYSVISDHNVEIDGCRITVYNVQLRCNIRDTPWCMTPKQLAQAMLELKNTLPTEQFKEIEADVQMKMNYMTYRT